MFRQSNVEESLAGSNSHVGVRVGGGPLSLAGILRKRYLGQRQARLSVLACPEKKKFHVPQVLEIFWTADLGLRQDFVDRMLAQQPQYAASYQRKGKAAFQGG